MDRILRFLRNIRKAPRLTARLQDSTCHGDSHKHAEVREVAPESLSEAVAEFKARAIIGQIDAVGDQGNAFICRHCSNVARMRETNAIAEAEGLTPRVLSRMNEETLEQLHLAESLPVPGARTP